LVLFSEPHAYISPSNYEKLLNVPTWNYISVHAYGKAKILHEQEEKAVVLEQTISFYEAAYKVQWDQLPEDYRVGMMKGIVAFEIVVTDIQGKKKLSQNKTMHEQANIVASLSKSTDSNEQTIAAYMQEQLSNPDDKAIGH
jgi:transcriptional regulator